MLLSDLIREVSLLSGWLLTQKFTACQTAWTKCHKWDIYVPLPKAKGAVLIWVSIPVKRHYWLQQLLKRKHLVVVVDNSSEVQCIIKVGSMVACRKHLSKRTYLTLYRFNRLCWGICIYVYLCMQMHICMQLQLIKKSAMNLKLEWESPVYRSV